MKAPENLPPWYNHPMSAPTTLQQFESAIVRVRDVLRREGITGMDSMKHCTLYIAARYLTATRVAQLKIPVEFGWESLLALSRTGLNESERLKNRELSRDRIYNAGAADHLVNHFDTLFKTTEFSFRVSPAGHGDIMEVLATIRLEDIELSKDLLGWVYEQHLSKGSAAARDLGQYFTDRTVTKYLTSLCDPRRRADGSLEYVCDPSMGTGGFLTSAVQHLRAVHGVTSEELARSSDRFHGCDIDRFVGAVAAINMFMESRGTVFPNIAYRDSLHSDTPIPQYNVILANMPFGVKGLKFADSCERVKALGLNGTKSEPLFLQLMMVALAPGGRCAVVVPDGMLVNSSKCHDGTRKYLLDHFEVKRVIKMEGKFFMNTGIKPSILFFENTGKPTTTVEFWTVEKDAKGNAKETHVLTVERDSFDASCSFDMRKYQKGDAPAANPVGFPMVKLVDVVDCKNGKNIPQEKRSKTEGVPYYASNGVSGFVETSNFQGPATLLGDQGSCWMKSSHFVNDDVKFYAGNHTVVMKAKNESLSIKFLHYYLKLSDLTKFNRCAALIPELDKPRFFATEFPLPPRPIQDEIVATLDRIYAPGTTDLADTLKLTSQAMDLVLATPSGATLEPIVEAQRLIRKSAQMVADVKAQMVAVVKSVGSRGFEEKAIKEVMNVVGGKGNKERTKEKNDGYTIPYYESNGIFGYVSDSLYTGEYTVTARCMSIGCVHYINGPYYPSDHTINFTSLDTSIINNRYFYYWLLMNNDLLKALTSGIKPGIRKSDVAEIKMPVPPLDFQQSVVARLAALESQVAALESLQRSTEDNARFILDSYLGAKITEATPPEAGEEDAEETAEEPASNTLTHA